jgi:hypothetical protein
MMTTTFRTAALMLAAALFTASGARAQNPPTVTLTPERSARWDVTGHAGWLGVNKSDIFDTGWNDWYDAGSFGASAGYYWNTHLKTEFDVATTTESRIFAYESLSLPGEVYPYQRSSQHSFRSTTFSGGASYQFFENSWFHPFLGLGVDVVRESTRIDTPYQFIPVRDGRPPLILPAGKTDWEASVTARPFATGGFKWYASERAFIRGDLRTSFSSKAGESVVLRLGVGFDF